MGKLLLPLLLVATLVLFGIADAASNIIYISNTITTPIDFPQNAIYTISGISGGVAPYTFNAYFTNANVPATNTFLGSNTFSPSATANAIILTINTIATNSITVSAYNGVQSSATELFSNTITTGANTIYGSWTFNAFFVDSTGANTIASVNSLTIDPAPTLTSLTPSNTILDSGQSVTYNVILSGGTGPFTVNLMNNGVVVNTIIWKTLTPVGNVITFGANIPAIGSQTFNVIATDNGASTPYVFNSASNTITVNPAPSIALTVTPSNSITYGEAFTVNAVISGGTGNFLVVWTLNGNTITPTVVNAIATSNTITLPAAGTYAYEVAANDVGTTTNYVIPSATNTVVVSPNSLLAATVSGNPGTSYFEHTVSITFTGTPTINNQSLWYLYVNGALFGKTQSKITWSETEAPAGTYAFTFSNPGNSNYTANSISTKLVILYPPSGVSSVQQTTTTTVTTVSTTATTTIPAVIQVTGSSAKISKTISAALPVLINFTNEKAIINVYTTSSASVPVNVSVANVTSTAPAAPANYTLINALNVSISTNATISSNVTIAYPCSTPATSIAPFIYENGTWNPITKFFANPVTCTVSFAMPKDPIVGIFSKTVTTTVSTTLTTTQTTVPTTIPVTPAPSNSAAIALVVVIIIVIVIIVIAYYLTKSKKGRNR
ncbi:MAG: hypothetical protein QXS81_05520 [Candidatus Micrarchaeaceae archaeon]